MSDRCTPWIAVSSCLVCKYIDRISCQILENERESLFELLACFQPQGGLRLTCNVKVDVLFSPRTFWNLTLLLLSVFTASVSIIHPSIHPRKYIHSFIHSRKIMLDSIRSYQLRTFLLAWAPSLSSLSLSLQRSCFQFLFSVPVFSSCFQFPYSAMY